MKLRFSTSDWPPGAARALAVLSITMIITWGTLFYGITLIGPRIMADTGWSKTLIYGAFSLAMLASGLIAPRVGGWIDQHGGRGLMVAGAIIGGLGYVLLAFAKTPLMLYVAYAVIGIGMAGSLYDPAFASLARIAGPKARTAITMLTLGGGLASTVFWPLGLWLLSFMDWRGLCLVYAGLNGILCAVLHYGGISNAKAPPAVANGAAQTGDHPLVPTSLRGLAILILAFIFMAINVVSSSMSVHLVALMGSLGLTEAQAIAMGALIGPFQSAGRLIELMLGGAYPVMRLGYVAVGLMPLSFAIVLAAGGALWAVYAFAVTYGLSNGLVTIARGVLVLGLLGRENYGRTLGAIAAPTLAAKSVSPLAFAVLIDWMGAGFALGVMAACGVVAFSGMVALGVMLHRAAAT